MNKGTKPGIASILAKDDWERKDASHVAPINQTTTFRYPSVEEAQSVFKGDSKGLLYTRWDNPNWQLVEHKLALVEGYDLEETPACRIFASGMAAINALFETAVPHQGIVIAQNSIYGTTRDLLDHLHQNNRIQVEYVDPFDLQNVEHVLKNSDKPSLIYLESPSNPVLRCPDISGIYELVSPLNIPIAVDATFATPIVQRPLTLGASYVVHSTTKFLNGHSNALGGCLISKDPQFAIDHIDPYRKKTGAISSPFDAWILNNGLKTLPQRVVTHSENAMKLAEYLNNHPKVEKVFYPFLRSFVDYDVAKRSMVAGGGTLSFDLKGSYENANSFMKALDFCTISASIGCPDTLVQHPASMSHSMVAQKEREDVGIRDTLVRVSVGLEDIEDLIKDFEQALNKS